MPLKGGGRKHKLVVVEEPIRLQVVSQEAHTGLRRNMPDPTVGICIFTVAFLITTWINITHHGFARFARSKQF